MFWGRSKLLSIIVSVKISSWGCFGGLWGALMVLIRWVANRFKALMKTQHMFLGGRSILQKVDSSVGMKDFGKL